MKLKTVLAAGLLGLIGLSSVTAATIKIGYSDWPGYTVMEVAKQKGWFKDAGLDVEMVWFEYSPSIDAFAAGKIDADMIVAGILRHGRALCAVLAPTVNSYKRLIRRGAMSYYSWAPVFNSFGTNNRTNSVRIPMGGGRCESRNADSSCNPYLAAALVLAAGLEGVREQLDPGEPHHENLYELSPAELEKIGVQELPRTLAEAVDAFEADPFIEKVLGTELKAEFVRYKRAEWQEYHQSISEWEINRYAKLF